MRHEPEASPAVRRHRRIFAALRILQMSLAALGGITLLAIFGVPASAGSLQKTLLYMAKATPLLFAITGAALLLVAFALQAVAIPLKRHWAGSLKGWIE